MKQRFYHKTEGQNVVLIAGILALLIGMAALAVDLGVTYAEQRNIVRGTNAASLAGMNRLISGGRDADVARAIYESLRSNGIPVTPPGEAPQPGIARSRRSTWEVMVRRSPAHAVASVRVVRSDPRV